MRAQLAGHELEPLEVSREQRERRPFAREALRDRAADPGSAAGDHDVPFLEALHRLSPLVLCPLFARSLRTFRQAALAGCET